MQVSHQQKAAAYSLTVEEVNAVANTATNLRDRTIIKSLFWLGLRRCELVALDVRDLDLERKIVTVQKGKGSKTRSIPIINEGLLSDIRLLQRDETARCLFVSKKGGNLTEGQINSIVAKLGEKAGIKNPHPERKHLNPHLFRHSIARYLKSAEFPLEWIQNFLGHSSIKTTMDEYGTLSLNEMIRIAEKKLG